VQNVSHSPVAAPPIDLSTAEERAYLREALRRPMGQYRARRAAQLSGIPQRTLYDWARHDVLTPDYPGRPTRWSYRDLVYLRLLAWLRGKGMPRPDAAARVRDIRAFLQAPGEGRTTLRSDGIGLLIGDENVDRLSGQAVLDGMLNYFDVFDLTAPIKVAEWGRRRLWGPNLVRPSGHTSISPLVMAGEPCVRGTRVPTSVLYALRAERGLQPAQLARLYPGLEPDEVADALALENRLRLAA
jgi:uncharacterized protein (DUF433 family)